MTTHLSTIATKQRHVFAELEKKLHPNAVCPAGTWNECSTDADSRGLPCRDGELLASLMQRPPRITRGGVMCYFHVAKDSSNRDITSECPAATLDDVCSNVEHYSLAAAALVLAMRLERSRWKKPCS